MRNTYYALRITYYVSRIWPSPAFAAALSWGGMKIIVLTAGTGSFHCGTCIRDNALVRELRRQGHDAMLVPMYLAPTLDEESTLDDAPLFFSGINVYLQHKLPLFRKLPRW